MRGKAMQLLYCAKCLMPFKLGIPPLVSGMWYAHCPTCGAANELEPILEPVTAPTFKVVGVLDRARTSHHV